MYVHVQYHRNLLVRGQGTSSVLAGSASWWFFYSLEWKMRETTKKKLYLWKNKGDRNPGSFL